MSSLNTGGGDCRIKPTGKRYSSLTEMVRETASEGEGEFVRAFEERMEKRQLIRTLMALRASMGMSQKDIAKVMGHSQSKVSKLESGFDDDFRLGELSEYLNALGYNARIVVTKPTNSIADEIKYHWHCLGKMLDRLLDLASKDTAIAVAIGKFGNEIGVNYMSRIVGFMNRLPVIAREKTPSITMHVEQIDDFCEEEDSTVRAVDTGEPLPVG